MYYRETLNVNLSELDTDLNRLTGNHIAKVIILGPGSNNQPTGTVIGNTPARWTVNGGIGPPLNYSSLPGPVVLVFQRMVGAQNVVVSQLTRRKSLLRLRHLIPPMGLQWALKP